MSLIKEEIDLENYANKFRRDNQLSLSEPIRIKSILQKNNILTVYLPLSSNFSGMAIKSNGNSSSKYFILVNSKHPIGKQHFTICHELYHLFFQENFSFSKSNAGTFDKNKPEEYNADVFASFLLLPEIGLQEMIPASERKKNSISLKTILSIEQFYSCSRTALLYRLKKAKKIDHAFYDRYSLNVQTSARQYGYDVSLYNKGNEGVVIGDYGIKARELFENGDIAESTYFSFLEDIGINLEELEENGE